MKTYSLWELAEMRQIIMNHNGKFPTFLECVLAEAEEILDEFRNIDDALQFANWFSDYETGFVNYTKMGFATHVYTIRSAVVVSQYDN